MTRCPLVLLLLGLAWPSDHARAQPSMSPPAPGSGSLTLVAAQRLALEFAPNVVLEAARAQLSAADVAVAGMLPNPQVTVGTTAHGAAVYGNFYMLLPLFGQRRRALDVAEAQSRVALTGVDVTRVDARLSATVAWVDLWELQEESDIAERNVTRREVILDTAQSRLAEGAGPRLEVLRADAELRRSRAEFLALASRTAAARATLSGLLDPQGVDAVRAQGDPNSVETPPTLASLEPLVQQHPLVERARQLLGVADALIAKERRARWPLVGVQVGAQLLQQYPPPRTSVSVGLTVALPVFNRPLIDRASAARATAQTELEAVVRQVRTRIAVASASYIAAATQSEAQVHEVLPVAEEAAELSVEAYQSGGLDLTALLAAEQALSDARLTALRSMANRARAQGLLEHAIGRAL